MTTPAGNAESNAAPIDPRSPLWYGEQDENGVDLSLIRENLKLSPRDRLIGAEVARRSTLRLMEYGRRKRDTDARQK
jgi:hypothetical protein